MDYFYDAVKAYQGQCVNVNYNTHNILKINLFLSQSLSISETGICSIELL